jgi:hypothetical protein
MGCKQPLAMAALALSVSACDVADIDHATDYATDTGEVSAAELPVTFACWLADGLRCQRGGAGGLLVDEVGIEIAGAGGFSRLAHVRFDLGKNRISLRIDDQQGTRYRELIGLDSVLDLLELPGWSFPIELTTAVRARGNGPGPRTGLDGMVAGVGGIDPFVSTPIVTRSRIAAPDDATSDSPVLATLPFGLWEVRIESDGTAFNAVLDEYPVELGADWKGASAGQTLVMMGLLPRLDDKIVVQKFFLPIDGSTHTITGTANDATDFIITGPGRYRASSEGLTPIAP